MTEEKIPPIPPERVQWLYKHGGEIKSISVDYVMLTEDTSKTIWHIVFVNGNKVTVDKSSELTDALDFYPHRNVRDWRCIAALKEPLVEMCRARKEWEKKNAAELAQYKRLHSKYGA